MRDRDSTSSVLTLCPRPTELTEAATPPLSDARTSNRLIRMAQAPVTPRQSRSPPKAGRRRLSPPAVPYAVLQSRRLTHTHTAAPTQAEAVRPGQEPTQSPSSSPGLWTLGGDPDARPAAARRPSPLLPSTVPKALPPPPPPPPSPPPPPQHLSLWTAPAPQVAVRFIGHAFLPLPHSGAPAGKPSPPLFRVESTRKSRLRVGFRSPPHTPARAPAVAAALRLGVH